MDSLRVPGAGWRVQGAVPGAVQRALLGAGCCACLMLGAGARAVAAQPAGQQAAAPAPAVQPAQMPSLPMTQLDERAWSADVDSRTFTLTFAQPVPIGDLLLLLVRGTNLSIVPDPSVSGSFIGELKNVTVRQALALILPPLGLDYRVDGNFISVSKREPDTRIYNLNYSVAERTGSATVAVTGTGATAASVSTTTKSDVFADLAHGVQTLLSEHGIFNVDRKAGLLQVTDWPERLDRIGIYLDAVQDRVQRQAQIDARLVEVELNDEKATGIDWTVVSTDMAGMQTPAQRAGARPALTGLRITDVGRLMAALATQGKVTTLASPRLLALNNEPAIIHLDSAAFSVTPQIGADSALTLSLSPIVHGPPMAEADMIARVADGETLVIWGFTRDRETRERKTVGQGGGWFGRATVVTRRKVEMIILLTPRIVS